MPLTTLKLPPFLFLQVYSEALAAITYGPAITPDASAITHDTIIASSCYRLRAGLLTQLLGDYLSSQPCESFCESRLIELNVMLRRNSFRNIAKQIVMEHLVLRVLV